MDQTFIKAIVIGPKLYFVLSNVTTCHGTLDLTVHKFKSGVPNLFSQRVTKLNPGGPMGHDLKRTKKNQIKSLGNNHNYLMRHLMLFTITKRCNIMVK